MPVTPDLFPSWARRFPFPPRDSVCSPRPPLSLVSLKDLREGGNCQDGSSGSEEVMNVLVRVFVQSERFGASRPVGRFLVPLASSFPFLTWKGAEGPTSPRKDTSHLISSESCGVGPLSLSPSLSLEVTLAGLHPDPTLALLLLRGWRGKDGSCPRQPWGGLSCGRGVRGSGVGRRGIARLEDRRRAQDSADFGCASAGGTRAGRSQT